MAQKETLKVVGSQTMRCAGCERTVTFTLSQLHGVKVIKADHKTQVIEIVLTGDETDLDKVKAELDWIGYEVKVAA
ncbi:MAG: heavy-metal-associated domain-containing protein [Anaerolineae bacterium]